MSDFWVYTDGLAKSAEGFHVRGTVIHALVNRIDTLMGQEAAAALGNDGEGRALLEQLRRDGGQLSRGVRSWGQAVDGTGTAVTKAARAFVLTEENNGKLSRTLDPGTSTALQDPGTTTPTKPAGHKRH